MSIAGAIALYFIVWWLTLFAMLPIGVRSQHEDGDVTQGTDPGAPKMPMMAKKALWNDVHEARADFPHADPVGKFTVFNIKKNEYRLITVVHYNRFKVYIRAVLTHEEYDKGKWKDD